MQRYCDGCQRHHDLTAFDLDNDGAATVCRVHTRAQARQIRRRQQSKIEELEQQRRSLIAALVNIDREIAAARAKVAPVAKRLAADSADVFGAGPDTLD